jgi:ribonuclease P/MRP protein subunit POP7
MTSQLARKSLPLSARIQTIQNSQGSGIGLENAREVVVIGTGRTIEKVVNVAAFFQGQGDCDVRLNTGSMGAVDEIMEQDEDDGGGGGIGEMRERMVSCLEVSIRLK